VNLILYFLEQEKWGVNSSNTWTGKPLPCNLYLFRPQTNRRLRFQKRPEIILDFSHTEYGRMVLLPEASRATLARDFA
jgi:hypothetical protein